ncbi:phosphoribosylaminoimidazolesuccinocarboxamide synthase [Batrachochytrium salamandrivorans]|nr:phosphoribosylaminoimidazolesuccinocarboxamide synthase [Batrachochytrium salamandrivorans]
MIFGKSANGSVSTRGVSASMISSQWKHRPAIPIDYSFKDKSTVADLLAEEPHNTAKIMSQPKDTVNTAIRLSNNHISSLADLPACIGQMKMHCNITWLDISFNRLTNIDCALLLLPNLCVLYLHANCIDDIAEVDKLEGLTHLFNLTLHGNPLEHAKAYRSVVLSHIPKLKHLTFNCPDLKLIARGKVRDIYNVDEHSLLFVATDRISAFDVIMKSGIAGKGKILTQISEFWFELLKDTIPNHIITCNIDQMPSSVQKYRDQLEHRCMLVRKLRILPVEAIVRGYITELPEALFTPSTKAELGDHVDGIIGERYSKEAREYAKTKGIIIADTKVEFGVSESGELFLADEVLLRLFAILAGRDVRNGKSQPSFDKQYLRDYLTSIHFDKKTGVELPQEVMDNTLAKYVQVYKILTGKDPVL